MELRSKIESLLFVSAKALSAKELAAAAGAKPGEVEAALAELESAYADSASGIVLVRNGNSFQLATSAANSDLVKAFLKDEASGELSQPSLEALTIIAYRGPIAKADIERIRGVNCSLIIRNLLLRGLIEEKADKRRGESAYSVTHDFIRFLGLSRLEDLPDYEKMSRSDIVSQALEEIAPEAAS